jgi:hypothetical protein
MDALELLKQDHQNVKELFKQGQETDDKKRQRQIFKEIKSELETMPASRRQSSIQQWKSTKN